MQITGKDFARKAMRALTKQKAVVAVLVMLFGMLFSKTNFYTPYNILSVLKDSGVNLIIAFGVTLPRHLRGVRPVRRRRHVPFGNRFDSADQPGSGNPPGDFNRGAPRALSSDLSTDFWWCSKRRKRLLSRWAMGMLIKGVCQQLTDAHPISSTNMAFMTISNGKLIGNIPNLAVIMVVFGVLMYLLLRFTGYGRTALCHRRRL